MGKSYVLKDAAGRPGGYLMQLQHEICCRASGISGKAQAVLLFTDGTQKAYPLDNGVEMRWADDAHALCGGYICTENRLLLATDDDARQAFAMAGIRYKPDRPPHAKQEREKAAKAEEEERIHPEAGREKAYAEPQRRWPPPPCWPQAVYRDGRWQEEES